MRNLGRSCKALAAVSERRATHTLPAKLFACQRPSVSPLAPSIPATVERCATEARWVSAHATHLMG